ncbi:MAG: RNA polymerase sigma factor [Chitinophagaceae bacterium]
MKNLTDEELMSRVAAGELDCMRVLFERYQAWIYNFLLQMVQNRDVSEDLTQSTFYKVMKHRSSYNGSKFASWIFQIARNLCMDHFREAKQKMAPMDGIPEIADTVEDGDQLVELKKALLKLPEADREILIMSRFHGMKYLQIAEVLNSTEAAVKVRVHRAVKKLRTVYFESVEI